MLYTDFNFLCSLLSIAIDSFDLLGFSFGQVSDNTELGASLLQVLHLAGLLEAYQNFLFLFNEAEQLFIKGNTRHACDIMHQIWMHPQMVPALLLCECFYNRQLIFPLWRGPFRVASFNIMKKSGNSRQIFIPNKNIGVCMGVVNTMLQSSCASWSTRNTGFRPHFGTNQAIHLLKDQAIHSLQTNSKAYVISFDIQKAFNSVNIAHLFRTLHLQNLPHSIKYLIWQWHHAPVHYINPRFNLQMEGLAQGFSYSPTLFAWYLDSIFIQSSSWVGYADNFAAVFPSQQKAQRALQLAEMELNLAGFKINQNSITQMESLAQPNPRNLSSKKHFVWLGHGLSLPDCNVILNKYEQQATKSEPVIITIAQWDTILKSTDWINKVQNNKWIIR